jgi:hypothetical protein
MIITGSSNLHEANQPPCQCFAFLPLWQTLVFRNAKVQVLLTPLILKYFSCCRRSSTSRYLPVISPKEII